MRWSLYSLFLSIVIKLYVTLICENVFLLFFNTIYSWSTMQWNWCLLLLLVTIRSCYPLPVICFDIESKFLIDFIVLHSNVKCSPPFAFYSHNSRLHLKTVKHNKLQVCCLFEIKINKARARKKHFNNSFSITSLRYPSTVVFLSLMLMIPVSSWLTYKLATSNVHYK